jgi:hypothetical protein
VVATHDIHCDSHKDAHQHGPNTRPRFRARSGSGSDCEDLAPLVITTGRANPV